ncbi:MAG: orotidine-5'-phosphate decarboxylase [Candidatus Woesearchaeota archaeon]|nr:MAG: orotidine-5'-phosphate decarboxylase [Candidatus Woesearchaeota archaeon]
MSWNDDLEKATEEFKSIVCMGIDPDQEKIEKSMGLEKGKLNPKIHLVEFYEDILDEMEKEATMPAAAKTNYAFFARFGRDGLHALGELSDIINGKKIPWILDGKRGDIKNTGIAYAEEMFKVWGAGAITVNPYMGTDNVEPFTKWVNEEDKEDKGGRGVYVLVRTSNPGAKDFQDLVLKDGRKVYEVVLEKTLEWGNSVPNDVGGVVGATSVPELYDIMQKVGEYNPNIPILIPGVGKQGGTGYEVANGIVKYKLNAKKQRVNSSRALNYAKLEDPEAKTSGEASVKNLKKLNTDIAKGGVKL